jgi:Gram-negative bacterial tonB protein.
MGISMSNAKRKRRLFLFIICISGIFFFSQVLICCKSNIIELKNITSEKIDSITTNIDPILTEPVYPGGVDSLVRYVERHIEFTPYMNEIDVTGKIIIRFVVDEDGSITKPEILRSLEKHYDEAAIKSLMSAPRFIKPAYQMGVPTRSYYIIPVKIMLK